MSHPPTALDREHELTPADLAAWRCDQTDPIEYRMAVLDWLYRTGVPDQDEHRRGISEVRLERHGETTTVVVTRRTPAGAKPVRERWPMTSPPPARPAEPTLDQAANR